MSSNSCFSVLLLLLTYTLLAKLVCAQQQLPPTPYIPANRPAGTTVTKTVIESRPATEDGSSSPTTSPKPHFMPTYGSSLSLPGGTNIAAASSIWQALTSVQSTWTAGPAYPSITSAVYPHTHTQTGQTTNIEKQKRRSSPLICPGLPRRRRRRNLRLGPDRPGAVVHERRARARPVPHQRAGAGAAGDVRQPDRERGRAVVTRRTGSRGGWGGGGGGWVGSESLVR
ncbi:hypothetical protein MBM_05156 [Drepanopeziza brunnea f. sp. 'multigermtubi' MB_m1]|uniref:Uncharacterized protein n=1 Tax=Marssonina brunnea f. sp. multigermtubi (strain MB_m1) TaxID=1072389 RepID=K1WW60_MARBU|nr:uncharacterized protein MBM_05156 [Drepanopeziza brunnea f. sp. 'multigermtubi' MB_m1]EKD16687.1 hypothetical protein MBM_05156 [Drepanopeziza brunnea f. sp. 'multigermtubi' MB_m1]